MNETPEMTCHTTCPHFTPPRSAPSAEAGHCLWATTRKMWNASITAGSLCKFPSGYCSPPAQAQLDIEMPPDARQRLQDGMMKARKESCEVY